MHDVDRLKPFAFTNISLESSKETKSDAFGICSVRPRNIANLPEVVCVKAPGRDPDVSFGHGKIDLR